MTTANMNNTQSSGNVKSILSGLCERLISVEDEICRHYQPDAPALLTDCRLQELHNDERQLLDEIEANGLPRTEAETRLMAMAALAATVGVGADVAEAGVHHLALRTCEAIVCKVETMKRAIRHCDVQMESGSISLILTPEDGREVVLQMDLEALTELLEAIDTAADLLPLLRQEEAEHERPAWKFYKPTLIAEIRRCAEAGLSGQEPLGSSAPA